MEQNVGHQSKSWAYFASVTTGLEHIAQQEVCKTFGGDAFSNRKELPGRLLFNVPKETQNTTQQLTSLKSVEHLQALVGILPLSSEKDLSLQLIRELPSKFGEEDWARAHSIWKDYQRVVRGVKNLEMLASPLFRVSCKMAGPHSIKSVDVASALAAGVMEKFPTWRSSTKAFEMEVFLYVRFSTLYLSLSLTEESLSLQQMKTDRSLGATALRPAIAYGMASLAQVKPGDLVVDPMCGCGTIPEIVSFCFEGTLCLAGDINDVAVHKTQFNFNHTKAPRTDTFKWSASRLPFASDSVDVILTDLPFGKRMGSNKANQTLYPSVLAEFSRVLKSGTGRMVLLTSQKQLLLSSLKDRGTLKLTQTISINQGGLDTFLFVLEKKVTTASREIKGAKKNTKEEVKDEVKEEVKGEVKEDTDERDSKRARIGT